MTDRLTREEENVMRQECMRKELYKCFAMPAFYVLLLFSLGFNLFLLYDGLAYKMEAIHYDAALLKEDPALFAESYESDAYQKLDMQEVFSLAAGDAGYGNLTEHLIRKQYARLQERADSMTEEEKNSLTFTGEDHLHAFLFEYYTKAICVESVLIVLLIFVYSLHYERMYQTEELVLATKCGKEIYAVKDRAAAYVSLLLLALLWTVSYGIYFVLVDYSCIWLSGISSSYNAFRRTVNGMYLCYYPCVTWVPFSFVQYFIANLFVVLGILAVVMLYVSFLAKKIKHTLALLMLFFISTALLYVVGNMLPVSGPLEYVCKLNPVHLVTKCGYWFMDYAPGDTYPIYECLTLFVWGTAGLLLNCPVHIPVAGQIPLLQEH